MFEFEIYNTLTLKNSNALINRTLYQQFCITEYVIPVDKIYCIWKNDLYSWSVLKDCYYNWFKENHIKYDFLYEKINDIDGRIILRFFNKEDLMIFKLTWL